jgi:hypothetical protein
MKSVLFTIVIFAFVLSPAFGQSREERAARELARFETSWLAAAINGDSEELAKIDGGHREVVPGDSEAARERAKRAAALLDNSLSPSEMKVRITGTVSLLTNDPGRNRSFYFLDTFNKRGGKWQVIATHFSPAARDEAAAANERQIEADLLKLEDVWAQVDVTNDRSIFDRIIAPEFMGTSIDGKVRNRQEWLAAWEYEGVRRATNTDTKVQIYSDSLAVVTGIDNTVKLDKDGNEVVHQDRFTDTWLKRNGQWQVVAAHVTRLK